MLRFIEKNFFIIVQRIGLLFALVSLIAVIALGVVSYEKINTQVSDKIENPVVDFDQYQNSRAPTNNIKIYLDVNQSLKQDEQNSFEREFDKYTQQIINHLQQLPDKIINKADMQYRIKILLKIKSNPYTKTLQLAYVQSLEKLIKQALNIENNRINIEGLLHWHDQMFAQQVNQQTQGNLLKMGAVKTQQMIGFIALGMVVVALGIFIMFVMMLAMLRIEQNTRK
ncbi:conserved hypothetical protein [Abyssogena phaseoliformis symbiont OG214]|uniref:hypothetical protein n=1 Tax=Abyssogena phaseoliformis symbiont TaxID=596095 RepID=UPI001914E845|nr:hypothetical protein [Abyssogena phaseoliformis symbiont]BBB22911.1 conserved hypothetical protein [Abyssogena phaseoliformis symbiont OG214]